MDFAVMWLILWFICFPKSFGRHLRTVLDAVKEPPK
jgi:hypothetical protein